MIFNIELFLSKAVSELDLNSPLNYGTPSSLSSLRTPRSGGRGGTPMRQRPDVRSDRKVRQVNLGANEVRKSYLCTTIFYSIHIIYSLYSNCVIISITSFSIIRF